MVKKVSKLGGRLIDKNLANVVCSQSQGLILSFRKNVQTTVWISRGELVLIPFQSKSFFPFSDTLV